MHDTVPINGILFILILTSIDKWLTVHYVMHCTHNYPPSRELNDTVLNIYSGEG